MAVPSSSISTGILPRGFCRRRLSEESVGSAGSTFVWSPKPNSEIAIRTLRPKGEAGDERRIIIAPPCIKKAFSVLGTDLQKRCGSAKRQRRPRICPAPPIKSAAQQVALPGDDEIDGLRAFTLFIGFNIETDALPLY